MSILDFDGVQVLAVSLVGRTVRIRLERSAIRSVATGEVVGDSGTGWDEKVVRPVGECWDDPAINDDSDGPDSAHCMTICPECIDSWATDWQLELVLPLIGSGGAD